MIIECKKENKEIKKLVLFEFSFKNAGLDHILLNNNVR